MSEFEPFTTRNRARCGTCRNFRHKHGWCEVIKRDVKANMSCGLYVPGGPSEDDRPPVRGEDMSTAALAKRRAEEARVKMAEQVRAKMADLAQTHAFSVAVSDPKVTSVATIKSHNGAVSRTRVVAHVIGTCGDCRFIGDDGLCRLFLALNQVSRGLFLLDPAIEPGGRCNAHVSRGDDGATLGNDVLGYTPPVVDALDTMAGDASVFADLVSGSSVNGVEPLALADDDEADFEQFVAVEARQ